MSFFMKRFIIFIALCLAAWMPIYFLRIEGYNFWSDYTGYIGILDSFGKYFYSIQENFFGSFRFLFNSTIFLLFQWLIFRIFSPIYGTFIIIFIINLANVCIGYKLSKIYLKHRLSSFLFALLFIYNPVYLYALYVNLTVGFLLSIAGINLFYLFFSYFLKEQKDIYLYIIPLTSLLIAHPFFYIFYVILGVYLLLSFRKKRYIIQFVFFTLLINAYWIIPFVIGFFKQNSIPNILGQAPFNKNVLEQYVGYSSSVNFMIRGNSFHKQFYGYMYPILSCVWLVLLIAIHKSKNIKKSLLVPLLIFFIFSLGGKGHLGFVFNFFWNNFSFLHFFRSFTNVLYLAWYYLLFLILFYLSNIYDHKKHLKLLIISVLVALAPFTFTKLNKFGGTTSIPKEYFRLQEIINTDKDDYYIFRLPYSMYEYYSWDITGRDKYFFEDFFNKGVVYNAIGMYTFDNESNLIGKLYRDLYSAKSVTMLGDYGIKYLIYSKDLTHINMRYYLPLNTANLVNLKKIVSTKYFNLYKIPTYKGKLISKGMNYKKINSTEYLLNFKNIAKNQKLIFLGAFDKDWELQAYNAESKKWVSLFKESHTIYNQWGNTWQINSSKIKEKKALYTVNTDGSMNFELRLIYSKQKYISIGFFISFFTSAILAIGCIHLKLKDER